jgi:glutathione S-transferase
MRDPEVVKVRKLERQLFRAWCSWLCYEVDAAEEDEYAKGEFTKVAKIVENWLEGKGGSMLKRNHNMISDSEFTI